MSKLTKDFLIKGWNNAKPKIVYDTDDGTVTHMPTSGDDGDGS